MNFLGIVPVNPTPPLSEGFTVLAMVYAIPKGSRKNPRPRVKVLACATLAARGGAERPCEIGEIF